jgi:hypothetical protein
MRTIYADKTVVILNIKNRFDLAYDSAASAGTVLVSWQKCGLMQQCGPMPVGCHTDNIVYQTVKPTYLRNPIPCLSGAHLLTNRCVTTTRALKPSYQPLVLPLCYNDTRTEAFLPTALLQRRAH